jgi:Arc/MetJ-type ribon-helix-helix transcriptional regulator
MSIERTSVQLPAELVDRVDERVTRTEFESADEYVAFVVGEVLAHVEAEVGTDDADPVDERQVRDRLESLGYLHQ